MCNLIRLYCVKTCFYNIIDNIIVLNVKKLKNK